MIFKVLIVTEAKNVEVNLCSWKTYKKEYSLSFRSLYSGILVVASAALNAILGHCHTVLSRYVLRSLLYSSSAMLVSLANTQSLAIFAITTFNHMTSVVHKSA